MLDERHNLDQNLRILHKNLCRVTLKANSHGNSSIVSKTLLSGQVAMSLNLQTANIQHQLIVFAFRVLWTDPTIKQRICEYICSDINLNRFGLP